MQPAMSMTAIDMKTGPACPVALWEGGHFSIVSLSTPFPRIPLPYHPSTCLSANLSTRLNDLNTHLVHPVQMVIPLLGVESAARGCQSRRWSQ